MYMETSKDLQCMEIKHLLNYSPTMIVRLQVPAAVGSLLRHTAKIQMDWILQKTKALRKLLGQSQRKDRLMVVSIRKWAKLKKKTASETKEEWQEHNAKSIERLGRFWGIFEKSLNEKKNTP